MAAPSQAKRDLKAPLSRSQRSSSWTSILVVGGVFVIVSFGGFLFLQSWQSTPHDAPLAHTNEALIRGKQEEKVNNFEKVKENFESQRGNKETLVISTKHGKLKVVLRPDLSPESVNYVRSLAKSGNCKRCNFYRAEKPGILQGIMHDPSVSVQVTKGECPPEFKGVKQDCPAHDPDCGCHGPIMTKGMVGWAGGDVGPDFFIDSYERPAKFWGNQHTVWGQIKDESSFALIERIWTFPVTNKGMTFLDEKIHFTLSLE